MLISSDFLSEVETFKAPSCDALMVKMDLFCQNAVSSNVGFKLCFGLPHLASQHMFGIAIVLDVAVA